MFYVPLLLNTQPGLIDLISFLVHESDRLEGKGRGLIIFFFNAMCAFSALQMSTSLVHPILWVNKEIKFRYKDRD